MTGQSRVTLHKGTAALLGFALVLAGAGASYLAMRGTAGTPEPVGTGAEATTGTPPGPSQSPSSAVPSHAPLPDVVVSLTAEAIARAGIVVAPVASGTAAGEVRLPGTVEPNAYRRVVVTPLVAGRMTRVSAELGASVRRGQTLASIYSPELAEAQTKYVAARAMLEAHDRELQRTGKLVEIGAASRQELERVHAEHAAQTAAVESARSQLALLGVPASTIESLGAGESVTATASVPAPIDGVVTERAANVGLNVDPATALFTVVDLSTVWITADVYENDLSFVRVGNETTITTPAFPGLSLRGRVSYIDPQVNPDTRTARIRVEVPNPGGELRLGMYTDVAVGAAPGRPSVPVIPRSAVQHVGDRTVVYVANANAPDTFTEREVSLGQVSGGQVEVTAGLQPGERVVTEGSFFVRAERERLGLRPAAATPHAEPSTAPPASTSSDTTSVQTATIVVSERGFEPAKVVLRAGIPARLTFVRTTDKTCATEVVFPSLDIRRALPLHEPAVIEFRPARTGELAFACGMSMLRGTVVVE